VETIFFEASKFISKYDAEATLTLYVHYLYYDLKSATFDYKKLPKTVLKSIFKTNEQLSDFQIVIDKLIDQKNLENALEGVSKIYKVKRKKIQLDTAVIKEVQSQHSGTVEVLNEYLKEEDENPMDSGDVNNEEIAFDIHQKSTGAAQDSIYSDKIGFAEIQISALSIFVKNNFSVSQDEISAFAKSKGVFTNQLIERINELCYEQIDDVLIEEDEEYYNINTNYYEKILAK
jgi:hypothetical protein